MAAQLDTVSQRQPTAVTAKAAVTNVACVIVSILRQSAHPRLDTDFGQGSSHPHQYDGTEQQ